MSKKSNPAIIGAFVVGAVSLLAVAVAFFGGSELFQKRVNYVAYFEEQTKGLRVGSNVILNGVGDRAADRRGKIRNTHAGHTRDFAGHVHPGSRRRSD
jgi:hypothetical protein